MNSLLLEQYENLINYRPLEELKITQDVSVSIQEKITSIPKAHILGTHPNALPLIVSVSSKIYEINPDVVIDIGSGKGYISRLLANYYNMKVICVDSNNERLKSTIRWDRLINDANIKLTATSMKDQSTVSNNIKALNISLTTIEDFKLILIEAIKWSNNPSQNQRMVLLALKNCGDMIYHLIDLYHEIGNNQLSMLVIPCCYHKISQFPYSDQLKLREIDTEKKIPHTLYLMDMMFYATNKGLVANLNYEFGDYFSFLIKMK